MTIKHVIFDTDPGVDDAMALLMLAHAPSVKLLGITTTFGNGDIATTTRNALYLTQRFGLDVPVHQGSGEPLAGTRGAAPAHVHGDNGMGDIALPDTLTRRTQAQPAYQFIIDSIKSHPKQVRVVAVARMTNLALALRAAPEIAELVGEVIIMGGAFGHHGHRGNVTPLAEANIHGDPLAADEVLAANWPITVLGLDVTQQTIMSTDYLRALAADAGAAGQFVWDISRLYQAFHRSTGLDDGFNVHDSSAVAYLLQPSLFTLARGQVRVVTEGFACGHTTFARPGAWSGRATQAIGVNVDSAGLLALYRRLLMQSPQAVADNLLA